MRIILLGSPGVGKGTQAKALASQLNLLHICSGDLLRQAVSEGSELGKQAKGFMDRGELVPDNLVFQLIVQRMSQSDAKNGFILDGYPRNLNQAIELDQTLHRMGQDVDAVISLEADHEVIIKRLTGRRLCSVCQANFHVENMPPKKEGICDYCGGKLYRRTDDQAETIENRLKVYQQSSLPLIDYYKGKILPVVANEEAGVVLKKMIEALDGYLKDSSGN